MIYEKNCSSNEWEESFQTTWVFGSADTHSQMSSLQNYFFDICPGDTILVPCHECFHQSNCFQVLSQVLTPILINFLLQNLDHTSLCCSRPNFGLKTFTKLQLQSSKCQQNPSHVRFIIQYKCQTDNLTSLGFWDQLNFDTKVRDTQQYKQGKGAKAIQMSYGTRGEKTQGPTVHHVKSWTGWGGLLWRCFWWKMYRVKSKVGRLCTCCVVVWLVWVYGETCGQLEKSFGQQKCPNRE